VASYIAAALRQVGAFAPSLHSLDRLSIDVFYAFDGCMCRRSNTGTGRNRSPPATRAC